MKVDSYLDHVAYTFEDQEAIYQLGIRYIKKLSIKEIIPFTKVVYDGHDRVMYEKEQLYNRYTDRRSSLFCQSKFFTVG